MKQTREAAKPNRRYRARAVKRTVAISALVTFIVPMVSAQISSPSSPLRMKTDYFGYTASVSPRVAYSDNIELAPDGFERDETILSTLFSAGAVFSHRRLTAVFSGDLDFSYLTDQSDLVINQNVGAAGTVTLADNLLYLDVAGGTSRQLVGDNARFSSNINGSRNQRADVHSYSVSPYVFHQFPNQSTAEVRYRFSQVFIDDDKSVANLTGGDFLNNSDSHEVVASYYSGYMFDRLRFTASAYGNRTVEDGSLVLPRFEFEQGTVVGEAQFAVNHQFSISGAVGYDEIDTDGSPGFFDDDELSGVFWRAGFIVQPGRKTRIQIEYGERFDDDFIEAELSYDLSKRFSLSGGASRTFRTRAQAISTEFRVLQRESFDFADKLRDDVGLSSQSIVEAATRFIDGDINAQTVGIGASDIAYLGLSGTYDQLQVLARVNYEDTDFGFRSTEVVSATLDVNRRLSRRLDIYGNALFRHINSEFDPVQCLLNPFLFGFDATDPLFDAVTACTADASANDRTNTVGGTLGARYQVYKNISVFGEYAHTERFSKSSLLEFGENAGVAGLVLTF